MANQRTQLTDKEKRFVRNIASGKYPSRKAAAIAAGYSATTADVKTGAILNRPLVRSELTMAFQRAGCTFDRIVRPIVNGLSATKTATFKGQVYISQLPDHAVRLNAHDRAVALLGGIPKQSDASPTSHGLNLFISLQQDKHLSH